MKITAAISALLFLFLADAQTSTPPPNANAVAQANKDAEKKPDPGRIEGIVQSLDGQPLRKAKVQLFVADGNQFNAPFSAQTDPAGKFVFEVVEPGRYFISAEKVGFLSSSSLPQSELRNPSTLQLKAGSTISDIVIKLPKQGLIRGRVLDPDGDPVGNAQVELLAYMPRGTSARLMPINMATSSEDGEFRITRVTPGSFWLRVKPQQSQSPGAVNRSGKKDDSDLREVVTTYFPNSTDLSGATAVKIKTSEERLGVDIVMQEQRVFRVKGQIDLSDIPAGVKVNVVPKRRSAEEEDYGWAFGGVAPKPDGSFDLERMPAGEYNLLIRDLSTGKQYGSQLVAVGEQNTQPVTISGTKPSTIEGSIRGIKFEDAQRKQITIGLQTSEWNYISSKDKELSVNGTFQLLDVTPNTYSIAPRFPKPEIYIKSATLNGQPIKQSFFQIESSGTLEIEVADDVGSVAGKLRSSTDSPASSAILMLPENVGRLFGQFEGMHFSQSDQTGRFEFKYLAPGTYRAVSFVDTTYQTLFSSGPRVFELIKKRGTLVEVKPKSETKLELREESFEEWQKQQ
jgi:hypothetical protein